MVTKTDVVNSFLENIRWSSHHAFLIVMHQLGMSNSKYIHYQGTNPLTFCESPHLQQNTTDGDFCTHIFLGPWGLETIGTQIFLFAKFK